MTCIISMEFLPLSRRCSSTQNVPSYEERGEMGVFAGYNKMGLSCLLIFPYWSHDNKKWSWSLIIFLYWPRLVGQHSSILASLNLFAFLSTFSSFHSINCKKRTISCHRDLMLGQVIYLRPAKETRGRSVTFSEVCIYKMKLLVAFNSEI